MRNIREIDGLPVIDAKKPIVLHVSPKDVENADTRLPSNCAIARACKRELHAKEVRVHLTRTYVRVNANNWVRYATPPQMRVEIVAFDRGGSFQPGAFNLRPLSNSAKRVYKPTGPKKSKGVPRVIHILQGVRGEPENRTKKEQK